MQGNIRIISMNCRGLGDSRKRQDIFSYLKSKHYEICCIQDTHFVPNIENEIRREWGGKCFLSCNTSNSRGVAILFKDTVPVNINRTKIDNNGNSVVLDLTLYEYNITLVAIYGPNTDNPNFFVELQHKVAEFDNPHNIFCGDWNLVQDQVLDTFNYLHVNNPRSKAHVEKMKKEMDLCDPWRVQFPCKRNYTWRQPNPFKQSRLDFFSISSEMLSVVHNVDILPGYRTDHSLISLTLNLNKINRGPSYWKFNNCLLKIEGFVSQIKKTIKNTVLLYARNTIEFDRLRNIEWSKLSSSKANRLSSILTRCNRLSHLA